MKCIFPGELNESVITSTVMKFKNKTSTDSDGIDMTFVKKTIDCMNKHLSYIFNLSFCTGIFPNGMKIAKVIPLFKAGDKHSFTNNYRPVSLLSHCWRNCV